jgi:UDP-glucuronate decarboxylase
MNDMISDEDATFIAKSKLLNWEKFEKKTVLVTGANGYVPSYFVNTLMKRNELFNDDIKVIALCRNEKSAREKFASFLDNANFELIIQDVTDPLAYGKKINYYIHAASPAGYFTRHHNPADTFTANVIGCKNLLDHSRLNSVDGFLLLSSVDIYGRNTEVTRLSEDSYGFLDPLDPRGSYSSGKLAAESLCKSYYLQHKVPCKIVRPFQILGNGLNLKDGRLHADFISQLLSKKQITLKGDGSPSRTFMYVNDAIIAMLLVMLNGKSGDAYNVCSEEGEITVLQLAELMNDLQQDVTESVVFDATQREKIEVRNAIPNVLGDASKLRELGFETQFSLKEGIARMMQAYGIKTVRKL